MTYSKQAYMKQKLKEIKGKSKSPSPVHYMGPNVQSPLNTNNILKFNIDNWTDFEVIENIYFIFFIRNTAIFQFKLESQGF